MTSTTPSTLSSSHNWELYKENAAPLARGRNAAMLSKALSSPTSESTKVKKESDVNIKKFESLIYPSEKFSKYYTKKMEESNHDAVQNDDLIESLLERCKVGKDPIVPWLKYIKYHEETYPSDTHAQFIIMERCMHSLFHMPQYKNDVRYIRVCVLYADKTSNPDEQFKLFHKHKIGEYVAIYWLAWAWVAEKRKDFPFAEKIFNQALKKEAKPLKTVQERHKQFMRRMSRHWLNQMQKEQDGDFYSSEDEDKRGVLTGLTEEGVRQNNRSRGINAYSGIQTGGVLTVRNGQSSNEDHGVNGVKLKPTFTVFNDENDESGGYELDNSMIHYNDENQIPITRMVREKDRKKENTLSAEAWNERGGLKSNNFGYSGVDDSDYEINTSVARRWAGTGSDSIVAGGTSSQQAFQVFVDEDCVQNHDKESSEIINGTKRPISRGRRNERTLRQKLDDDCVATRKPLSIKKSSSSSSASSSEEITRRDLRGISKKASLSISRGKDTSKLKVGVALTKPSSSFDNKEELCFEEKRVLLRYYKLTGSARNFNLLQRLNENNKYDNDDSNTDMDIASSIEVATLEDDCEDDRSLQCVIDENEPPHKSQQNDLDVTTLHNTCRRKLNVTTLHNTVCDSVAKVSNPRKVLFDVNTSAENRSFLSAANNTSTASSAINESEAVGVHDDKEETVNTKFAARELSMMFSSPAPNGSSKQNQSSLKSSNKLLFSVHRNRQCVNESNDSSTTELPDVSFSYYRDADQGARNDAERSVFKIFEETSSQESSSSSNQKELQLCNDSDSDSSGVRSEYGGEDNTASLDDIIDLMKDIKHRDSSPERKQRANDFQIFCDTSADDDNDTGNVTGFSQGAELSEDIMAIGGDISCILHNRDGDTIRLQEKVSKLDITTD